MHRRTRLVIAPLALMAGAALAQPARVSVEVLDEQGGKLQDATIVATTPARSDLRLEKVTNKKGRAIVMVPNADHTYDFVVALEGYEDVAFTVDPDPSNTTFREVTLSTRQADAASAPDPAAEPELRDLTPAERAFNEGVEALQDGDLTTARGRFEEARRLEPHLLPAAGALAAVLVEQGEHATALSLAQEVLEQKPDNTRALRLVYEAQRGLGDDAAAEKALAELQKRAQGADAAALIFNEGAEASRQGDLESAQQRFEEALAIEPELMPAHKALVVVYARRGEWQKAVEAAETVLAREPDDMQALRVRYEAYSALGDDAKAAAAFQSLAAKDPATLATELFNSGVASFNAGDMDAAARDLERVVELMPDFADAHYNLGLCYTNSGRPEDAKRHLQRFLELDPDSPSADGAREMLQYLQ